MKVAVDFSRRLPDISRPADIPPDCQQYWRFAILNDGSLWVGDVRQSHPRNTRDGFYAALSRTTLFVSPRGYSGNLREVVTRDVIQSFARIARLTVTDIEMREEST